MNILCITHVDFEGPGVIASWAHDKGYHFKVVKPYRGEKLPVIDSIDVLIILGGPQSLAHIASISYLMDEVDLIKEAIAKNKKVLGICLGAQLIGEALNAKTQRSPAKEVGVYPITLTEAGLQDPILQNLPKDFFVTHWHNDMPGLTDSAIILAYSVGCPRQIIRYQPSVYGFQCHLEITQEGIEAMIRAVPEDLEPTEFTQTKEEFLAQDHTRINNTMLRILDNMVL